MKLHVHNAREFWAGIIYVTLSGFVLVYGRSYPMGTATSMGPGYFPRLLAIILGLLGLIAVANALRTRVPVRIGAWPTVPLAFVTVGVLAFAALIDRAGLALSVIVLMALSCYARLLNRPVEFMVLCVIVLVLVTVIFIYGIQLPFPLWKSFSA